MDSPSLFHRLGTLIGLAGNDHNAFGPVSGHASTPLAQEDPRDLANRKMLEAIAMFLQRHQLALDGETLSFAFDCVSNSQPRLANMVARRMRAREVVTKEWIAHLRGEGGQDEAKNISHLRRKLERTITDFSQTTRDARTATNDYQSALRDHVDGLDEVSKAGAVINELAGMARAMLDRAFEIERQMSRSERETRVLQKRLDQARRIAELDHLTGLPNRRAFEAMLEHEYADARRTRDALCVAFCDIDKFKAINDLHGHDAGDRVLKLVAQNLNEISDERCHVARHGGEEFVVLLRGRTIREAFDLLDATRENLAARRFVNRANDQPFGQVTFSAGIADVFAFDDARAALKAADEALYAAKDAGRNQVAVAAGHSAIRAA